MQLLLLPFLVYHFTTPAGPHPMLGATSTVGQILLYGFCCKRIKCFPLDEPTVVSLNEPLYG